MDYEKINEALEEMKRQNDIEFAYYEFQGSPGTKSYIAYYESEKSSFGADNKVYHYDYNFVIELYTPGKLPDLEKSLIEIFDKKEIYWQQGPQGKIKNEDMYLTTFFV